jgi:hypothetical protein
MNATLDDKIRIQVEIALADGKCSKTSATQEGRARVVGLSGAEIDAARSGRCFDLRADAAVRLACALRSTTVAHAPALAAMARRAGLGDADIEAIKALVDAAPPTTEADQPK